MLERVKNLLSRVKMSCLGKEFGLIVDFDKTYGKRVFIQICYHSVCNVGMENDFWKGRKWYLTEWMTDDEIVKTCYAAFESCIKHEIMEGFKVDGKILFNPHINFESLLKLTEEDEVNRGSIKNQTDEKGMKQGYWEEQLYTDDDSHIITGHYRDNVKIGTWLTFYKGQQMKETTFTNN